MAVEVLRSNCFGGGLGSGTDEEFAVENSSAVVEVEDFGFEWEVLKLIGDPSMETRVESIRSES